jgi:signal transduction histidine kinase
MNLKSLLHSGFDLEEQSNQLISRKYQYLNAILFIGVVGLMQGLLYNYLSENFILVKLEIVVLIVEAFLIWLLRQDRKFYNVIVFIVSFEIVIVFNMLYAFSYPSDLKIAWIFIYAPALIIVNDGIKKFVWLSILIITIYLQLILDLYPIQFNFVQTAYFTFVVIILSFLIFYFDYLVQKNMLIIFQQNKELDSLNKDLENRVQEEVQKNRDKEKYLLHQSKLAQMGEMISMIAHQWRQPLTAISATTSNLNFKLYTQNVEIEEFKKEIALIETYTQHMSKTIEDFRDFFKPDKEKEDISLKEIIESTLKIIHTEIESNQIVIAHSYSCKNRKILTYANEIRQVLLNIIKNAEDALLENNTVDPTIKINAFIENEKFIIEVSDNAGGIKEEILDKIFEPYFSTKKAKEGTGLGLYMSKTIIEDHCKGKLEVVNQKKGALFRITL